jgi:F0F1-type ATP synthase membrane subunit b/b'
LMFFITAIAFGVLLLLIYRYFVKYTRPINL